MKVSEMREEYKSKVAAIVKLVAIYELVVRDLSHQPDSITVRVYEDNQGKYFTKMDHHFCPKIPVGSESIKPPKKACSTIEDALQNVLKHGLIDRDESDLYELKRSFDYATI